MIGPGDVQWMTAGSGILHEEFHSTEFAKRGGPFEMVQLWVNLPAKDKMAEPGYQGITDAQIPAVPLAGDAGRVRVIAGDYDGNRGPARTFTPMNVWDVRFKAGKTVELPQEEGWTVQVVVLAGTVLVNGDTVLREKQMVTLSAEGTPCIIEANSDAKMLLLAGEPIDEPVVGYGPFVMNSRKRSCRRSRISTAASSDRCNKSRRRRSIRAGPGADQSLRQISNTSSTCAVPTMPGTSLSGSLEVRA